MGFVIKQKGQAKMQPNMDYKYADGGERVLDGGSVQNMPKAANRKKISDLLLLAYIVQ